jgi:hypothetical protein
MVDDKWASGQLEMAQQSGEGEVMCQVPTTIAAAQFTGHVHIHVTNFITHMQQV